MAIDREIFWTYNSFILLESVSHNHNLHAVITPETAMLLQQSFKSDTEVKVSLLAYIYRDLQLKRAASYLVQEMDSSAD